LRDSLAFVAGERKAPGMFDYVSLTGTTEDQVIEFVDHLHEYFREPVHKCYASTTGRPGEVMRRSGG
jgi:hypothetical protein